MNTMNHLMAEQEEIKSEPSDTLDGLLAQEGMIALLRGRIRNLEQFKALYFELKQTEQLPILNQAPKNVDQSELVATLKRQIAELESCQIILDSELDRLTTQNDQLRSDKPLQTNLNHQQSTDLSMSMLIETLQHEVTQATEMAFDSMRANADLSGLIHLLTKSFECNSIQELSQIVLDTINSYSLFGVTGFRNKQVLELYTTEGEVTLQHRALIDALPKDQLMIVQDNTIAFNTDHFKVHVSGFDQSDPKVFEEAKSIFRMLSIGINASARRVSSEANVSRERQNLQKLVKTTQKNLVKIESKQDQANKKTLLLIDQLQVDLQNNLAKLASSKSEKEKVITQLQQDVLEIKNVLRETTFVDENFKKVIEALNVSVSKS